MYPSKGGSGFPGQQNYATQQAYSQHPGTGFSGNHASGPEMGAQHALASRQSSMIGIAQESDATGFRTHPTQTAQYGGPYASVYGSAALSSGQQAGGASGKGAVSSNHPVRAAYPSSLTESSKYSSGAMGSGFSDDYLTASNRGYAQRGDQFSGTKNSDYAIDRRAYGEGAYTGRDLQSDQARRYADSASLGHQHQTDMHDHMDQASLIRQQQIIKAQSLHSGSDIRQAEYLAARAAPIHPGSQEFSSYGGRMDVDQHGLPIRGSSQYGAPHSASILGAPRRNIDDLIYAQGSNAGYGVSLPPGREYISGKGLLGSTGSEYQGGILSRDHLNLGVPTIAERKDDRDAFRRELDMREEERRRDMMREREREKERERDRERERERDRRDRERERDHRRGLDSRRERTPPRASKDRRASSAKRDERPRHASPRRSPPRRSSPRRVTPRRVSPRREAVHRHRSPVKEKKREYVCKVHPFSLLDSERDYLSINKRYPKLSISPEFTKVVLKWPNENLHLSLHTPVRFEHDFIEDNKSEETALVPVEDSSKSKTVVWNAKVILMSGVSSDTMDELCSDKSSDDRLIHFNNFLRFAILKKDRSFMAIGGQWNETLDGAEPSADGSSLIQTARRYVKDIAQLDLQNCQHWNPFLEIHYNRIGDDGLSSYKEITVLFVPDLLDCLPTLDSWQSMWLAHRKEVAEREKELASRKEKKPIEKESSKDEKISKVAETKDDHADNGSTKSKKAAATTKTGKVDDRPSKDDKISKVDDRPSKDDKISKVDDRSSKDEKISKVDDRPSKDEKPSKVDEKPSKVEKISKVDEKPSKVEKISKVAETKDEGGDSKNGTEQKQKVPELVDNPAEKKDEALVGDDRTDEKKVMDPSSSEPKGEVKKPTKKKIIRKVIKGKTADKKATTLASDETAIKHEDKSEKDFENKQTEQENIVLIVDGPSEPGKVKTFVRKRVIRKVAATAKSSQEEDNNVEEKKPEQDMTNQEGKAKDDKATTGDTAPQTTEAKVTGKKRIIRRVIKKRIVPTEDKPGPAKNGVQAESNTCVVKTIKEEENDLPIVKEEEKEDLAESSLTENKLKEDAKRLAIEKDGALEKKTNEAVDNKKITKTDKPTKTEKHVAANSEPEALKNKDSEKDVHNGKVEGSRQDKEKRTKNSKEKDAKHDTRSRSSKEGKEKAKSDEPPKQPGLFLKTKKTRGGPKFRSLSLSLAGLLEYNDKDTEESTFELSLFAESFNEMLQYQMGCRVLSFLEKLRKRFVIKHKQRKRQREEKKEKESEAEAASIKRPKVSDKPHVEKEHLNPGTQDPTDQNQEENNSMNEEATEEDKSDQEKKSDDEFDAEEGDLEEMYEEYEEAEEAASDAVMEVDEGAAIGEADTKSKPEVPTKDDDQGKEIVSEKNAKETEAKVEQSISVNKDEKHPPPSTEKPDPAKEEFVDKELLQAFRFFDYNKAGYIKMDDLRCLLHDLGKFLSHRDIKELVQSALYESSSARDDRIFYKKLARIRDL